MQLFVAFAQEQNLCTWRHVVPADWFGVISDIPLSLFSQISQPGTLHGFVIVQSVRTWLPPVCRLKV